MATDGTISGTESGITVTPAVRQHAGRERFPHAHQCLYLPANVTITALDPYGNIAATGYTDSVNLTGVVDTPSLPITFTPA